MWLLRSSETHCRKLCRVLSVCAGSKSGLCHPLVASLIKKEIALVSHSIWVRMKWVKNLEQCLIHVKGISCHCWDSEAVIHGVIPCRIGWLRPVASEKVALQNPLPRAALQKGTLVSSVQNREALLREHFPGYTLELLNQYPHRWQSSMCNEKRLLGLLSSWASGLKNTTTSPYPWNSSWAAELM